jgi:hypothetical protein
MGMKGPAITLRCDCGAEGRAAYGERFTCEHCGRVYDTSRIPAAEYGVLEAAARRYRRIGWAVAAAVALFVLALALTGRPLQVLVGLPIVLIGWFVYGRPLLRRRYRQAIASRPTWHLEAESPPRDHEPVP